MMNLFILTFGEEAIDIHGRRHKEKRGNRRSADRSFQEKSFGLWHPSGSAGQIPLQNSI